MKHDTIVNQPVIENDRFDLRPLRRSDAGRLELYSGDKRVARMTRSIPHPLPPGATEATITRALAEDRVEDIWVIDGTKAGACEFMGVIGLQRLDRGQSEIWFWVAPPYWDTGLATGAVGAIVEANPLDSSAIFASVFQDNPASARVMTNTGFSYLGDAEAFCVARNATVPTWTYSRKQT